MSTTEEEVPCSPLGGINATPTHSLSRIALGASESPVVAADTPTRNLSRTLSGVSITADTPVRSLSRRTAGASTTADTPTRIPSKASSAISFTDDPPKQSQSRRAGGGTADTSTRNVSLGPKVSSAASPVCSRLGSKASAATDVLQSRPTGNSSPSPVKFHAGPKPSIGDDVFSWIQQGAAGSFPGPGVPLTNGEASIAELTHVDVSRNEIAKLDVSAILSQLPALRRLNLSDNLLTSLASVVPLGLLPHLEEIDLRGNACCPTRGASRTMLLTALLVPEVSSMPKIVEAAKDARAVDTAKAGKSPKRDPACTPSHKRSPPERSQQSSQFLSGSTCTSFSHKCPPPSASCLSQSSKSCAALSSSASAPSLLTPLDSQPHVQERLYRSQHMQNCEALIMAERRARKRLAWLRGSAGGPVKGILHQGGFQEPGESWVPQHHRDLQRKVRGFLPRAHLYQATVGTVDLGTSTESTWCSSKSLDATHCGEGAGSTDWFPCLTVLNGEAITVQDLEEAAAYGGELHGAARAESSSSMKKRGGSSGESGLKLHRRRGENYHEYLVRVRTEFLRQRKRDEQRSTKIRFYSHKFERWRCRQAAKKESASESDEEDYIEPDPCEDTLASSTDDIDGWDVACSPAEERLFGSMEAELWAEQRDHLWNLENGGVIVDTAAEDVSQLDGKSCSAIDDTDVDFVVQIGSRKMPRSPTRPRSAVMAARTTASSSHVALPRAQAAKKKGPPEAKFMREQVGPHDHRMAGKQARTLGKTYSKARYFELAPQVSAIMNAEYLVEDRETIDRSKGAESDGKEASNTALSAAMERLWLRGLPPRSGIDLTQQKIARRQWLQQLAEDYPDDFCQADNLLASLKVGAIPLSDAEERPNVAVICSELWVLDLHGDPLCEEDWHWRRVWLSHPGRMWLGPVEPERPSSFSPATLNGENRPSLYLGGESISNLQVFPLNPGNRAPATIQGRPAYAFRIDLPGARFARSKCFAAQDEDTRDRWVRVCSTLVPRRMAIENILGVATIRKAAARFKSSTGTTKEPTDEATSFQFESS